MVESRMVGSIGVFIRLIMKLMYLAGMLRIDLIMISITDFIILVRSGGLVLIVRRLILPKMSGGLSI